MDNNLGFRIKQIRLEHGHTMEEFGKKFNTSKGTVNNWEKGRNKPNKENLKAIADLGNISVDELLYGNKNIFLRNIIHKRLEELLSNEPEDGTYKNYVLRNKEKIINDIIKEIQDISILDASPSEFDNFIDIKIEEHTVIPFNQINVMLHSFSSNLENMVNQTNHFITSNENDKSTNLQDIAIAKETRNYLQETITNINNLKKSE